MVVWGRKTAPKHHFLHPPSPAPRERGAGGGEGDGPEHTIALHGPGCLLLGATRCLDSEPLANLCLHVLVVRPDVAGDLGRSLLSGAAAIRIVAAQHVRSPIAGEGQVDALARRAGADNR